MCYLCNIRRNRRAEGAKYVVGKRKDIANCIGARRSVSETFIITVCRWQSDSHIVHTHAHIRTHTCKSCAVFAISIGFASLYSSLCNWYQYKAWFKFTALKKMYMKQQNGFSPIEIPWASYQTRKIADCACAGNAGNVFPAATAG